MMINSDLSPFLWLDVGMISIDMIIHEKHMASLLLGTLSYFRNGLLLGPFIFYLFLTNTTSFEWVVLAGDYVPKVGQNFHAARPSTSSQRDQAAKKHIHIASEPWIGSRFDWMNWKASTLDQSAHFHARTQANINAPLPWMKYNPWSTMLVKQRTEKRLSQAG